MIEPTGIGHAQRGAVELALHRLQHEAGGAGGAGGRGHDVDGGGPGPAQVLVRAVDQHLIAGVGVHGGHEALLDAEGVVEHLDERHEAVRGARGVRHDLVLGGVEVLVVDAHHEGGVDARGGGRHDHERGAALEVQPGLLARGEEAGGLDHHVDAEVAPRQILGVAHLQHLEGVAGDVDAVVDDADVVGQDAEDRVVLQQMGHGGHVAEVVDRDEVDIGAGCLGGAKHAATDASEAIDAHPNRHDLSSRGCLATAGTLVVG